ncbi:MAG: M28 family peptidase [Deltaproteobacteria bacterium]
MIGALLLASLVATEPPARTASTGTEAEAIVGEALRGGAFGVVAELTDGVGARPAGSPGAAAAVRWAEGWLRLHGIAVRLQPLEVASWVRGEERAEVVADAGRRPQPLAITALGGSSPTRRGGVMAEVLEVSSLEELRALGPKAKGKIVLLQHDMKVASDYGRFSPLRMNGPAEASRLGAAAALVRSLSTATFRLPHTGATFFPPGVDPIPAGALAVEDAELLHRLLARGPVRVRLALGGRMAYPPVARSANVVAEIRGATAPEEVVLIGAHLDSWDLGTGAVDDAAGVAMVLETMRILSAMPHPPRRTVRGVLFMNEENGLEGGVAYHEASLTDGTRHVVALEADAGAGRPVGLSATVGPGGLDLVRRLAAPLARVGAEKVSEGGGGADISPLAWAGVPFVEVEQDTSRYFDWHHSAADTLDKVDPQELARATAAFAWITWALAEAPDTLPRTVPPRREPWWKRPSP